MRSSTACPPTPIALRHVFMAERKIDTAFDWNATAPRLDL
jgi:hypothetical protein